MNLRSMGNVLAFAAFAVCAAFAAPAQAGIKVFACEPEWGALAQELGGALVEVSVATSALQDPHHIQAKPSLIARARSADLVACTGAELEDGWLPLLLQQSGNPKVQPGQPGHFAAADFVRKLGVPAQLDRAQGDVHAAGIRTSRPTRGWSRRWQRRWPQGCARSTRRTRPNTAAARPTSRSAGSTRSTAGAHAPRR